MKGILYLLLSLICLVSCSDEGMQSPVSSNTDEKVTYTIGMSIPEAQQVQSRVLGEWKMSEASEMPLQLMVFDANQFFVEAVDAVYKRNDDNEVFFEVTLSATEEKRIIHFILNSPKATADYTFGMEHELIGQLVTDNQTPSYWQRIEFPNGTAVYGTETNGKVTVTPSTDAQSRMTKIPLIRNFAKITVESKAQNFELLGFTIINAWNKGTVAPYNQMGGTGSFVTFHTSVNKGRTYAEIIEEGYEGTTPSDAVLMNTAPDGVTFTSPDSPFYLYERRNTYDNTNPTPTSFMLVKGKFGGLECYYKIDLIYEITNSGGQVQYYNVLRNFHYHIMINGVSGYGYDSASEAASHAASNNLNNSIDIRDFTNIAATVDNRLFVSYTDTTLVNTGTVQIKYRYMTNQNTFDNSKVTIEELTGGSERDCLSAYTKNGTDGDWQIVDVTFNKMPTNEQVYTNTLRFVVYNTLADGTKVPYLSREVDFNLRKSMNMIVECNPKRVPEGVDSLVTANILIPVGITEAHDPYQLFPLEFLVEAEQLSLYPNVKKMENDVRLSPSEMPVRTGTSIIQGVSGNTFRYVRTVTIEEYNALPTKTVTVNVGGTDVTGTFKVIPCHFKTNKAVSATEVYAQNKYFTLIKEGYFRNADGIVSDASLTESYYYTGKNVTVSFKASEDGVYTITSDNLNGSDTVTLSAGQTYTSSPGTFTTATWADAGSVIVALNNDEYVEIVASEKRDVLQMWVRSVIYNGMNVAGNKELGVYSSEESSKNLSNDVLVRTTVSNLKEGYTNVTKADLLAATPIYFSYVENDYVFVASASAEALAAHTADLIFNRFDYPTLMNVSLGEGTTKYYGIGKTFQLTFTTNKAGTYTISNVDGSVSNNILSYSNASTGMTLNGNNTFTVSAAGTYTMTCTTKTWSDQAAVYISLGSSKVSAIGEVRNVLAIPRTIVDGSQINGKTVTITYGGKSTTIQVQAGLINYAYRNYIEGHVVLDGIPTEKTNLTLSYKRNNNNTRSAVVQAGNLLQGYTIDFN